MDTANHGGSDPVRPLNENKKKSYNSNITVAGGTSFIMKSISTFVQFLNNKELKPVYLIRRRFHKYMLLVKLL